LLCAKKENKHHNSKEKEEKSDLVTSSRHPLIHPVSADILSPFPLVVILTIAVIVVTPAPSILLPQTTNQRINAEFKRPSTCPGRRGESIHLLLPQTTKSKVLLKSDHTPHNTTTPPRELSIPLQRHEKKERRRSGKQLCKRFWNRKADFFSVDPAACR